MKTPSLNHPALEIFQDLLSVPSPSANEDMLAVIVKGRIAKLGFEFETDAAGNVLVRLPGRDPETGLCIIAAHMDEIGFVVNEILPDGRLSVDRTGGLLPWKLGERPVEIIGDEKTIIGVASMGSGHASSADKTIKWPDVHILTGLSPEQLAKAGIRPGSCGVPTRNTCGPILFGDSEDPLVGAWTFDDRMGVVALLRLLEAIKEEGIIPHHPTIIAFTTQEEVGGQGAKSLAQREKPEVFIAIDGCPISPGSQMQMDGRPGIWSKDALGHYDQKLIRFLLKCAKSAGTSLQTVIYDRTASDASMAFSAGGTSRIAVFGHVRENSHGYEVARLSVFDNLLKILVQFTKTWHQE